MTYTLLYTSKVLLYFLLISLLVFENHAWNFKLILLAVSQLAALALYLTNAHVRFLFLRTPAIVLCGIWGILNVVFVISGIIRKEIFDLSLESLRHPRPLYYMAIVLLIFYAISVKLSLFENDILKDIAKMLLTYLVVFIVAEEIISLSLPGLSDVIFGVLSIPIISVLVRISVKHYYED